MLLEFSTTVHFRSKREKKSENKIVTEKRDVYIGGKWIFNQLKGEKVIPESLKSLCIQLTKFFSSTPTRKITPKKNVNLPFQLKSNFYGIPTTGDGSCLYHSISLLLTGTEKSTPALRAIEAVHIIINDEFINYLTAIVGQSLAIEETLDMRHYGEIGDVIILANILKREIHVHSFVGEQEVGSMRIPPLSTQINETLHLFLDIPAEHYTALVQLSAVSPGLNEPGTGVFQYPNNTTEFRMYI